MGKAAKREKAKRRKYFQKLSKSNLKKFDMEWEIRINDWLFWINKNAGKFTQQDDTGESVNTVFAIVDEAISILEYCGDKIFQRHAKPTYEVLVNQCCKALSRKELHNSPDIRCWAVSLRGDLS